MPAPEHTFLFTDLVGYTALTDAEGDDRAAEVALQLHGRVRELLPAFGAELVKVLGDGIMIRCADPAAAVRLGLRIVAELESDSRFPPVRVGIHSGSAVNRDGDWYGRGVNVASRLCTVAPGGEVLVSESTRAAAGKLRKVDFGEPKLHWLRNVTEPIETYSPRERTCPTHRVEEAVRRVASRRAGARPRLEAA